VSALDDEPALRAAKDGSGLTDSRGVMSSLADSLNNCNDAATFRPIPEEDWEVWS
jgi:hypothetical protein